MADQVRIISRTTIKPATQYSESSTHHHRRIELTPWDLRFLSIGPIQKGLLFPKPTSPQQTNLVANNVIDHLKVSLSRALHFFPPLAGRFAAVENGNNTSTFFISCTGAGAHFIHAVAEDVSLSDILEPLHVPSVVRSFFSPTGVRNWEGVSKPLLSVQVTELADGLFVGCTMNHAVGDGSSFWHFFNSWAEIARGLDKINVQPPILERWFPANINYPISIRFNLRDQQVDDDDKSIPTPVKERVFHFTKEKIAGLKAKANAEKGTAQISSLQALSAHLWRSVVRCQGIDSNQETNYLIGIGARTRLNPPLPGNYFGNAVYGKFIRAKVGKLLENGLGWAAWEMQKVIASQTDEEVRVFLEDWVKDPRTLNMSTVFANNNIITSSSPRFNVYGNDFGWGKPLAVRSGEANKFYGKITVFPGVEEGSIDVEVCLLPETLLAIGMDEEFMESTVTI